MSTGYDIFVSYRRESGAAEARLIRFALMEKGKRTFLDVTDLRAGFFDEALLNYIEQAPNFVLILSPGSLDRCGTGDDWFQREIAHALTTGSNIIPVFLPGFTFPGQLPEDLRNLPRHQGVDYSHRYFEAMVEEITKVCVTERAARSRFVTPLGQPEVQPVVQPVVQPARPENKSTFEASNDAPLTPSLPLFKLELPKPATVDAPSNISPVAADTTLLKEEQARKESLLGANRDASPPYIEPPPPAPIPPIDDSKLKRRILIGVGVFVVVLGGVYLAAPDNVRHLNFNNSTTGDLEPSDYALSDSSEQTATDQQKGDSSLPPEFSRNAEPFDARSVGSRAAAIVNESTNAMVGTVWEIDGNPYTVEFLMDGALRLVDGTLVDHLPARSWSQDGPEVTIRMPFVSYQFTRTGNRMRGTQSVMKGPSKPATASLLRN